jgi:glycosyltransferase involved in cell wall biosynthesis
MAPKKISIISPCFNEEENIGELYSRVSQVMDAHPEYQFELLLIDNASTDRTVERIREIIARDARVKAIVNMRNFGHIRSPYWGILQTTGDATVYLASDLQDPPELIPQFLEQWEKGWQVVLAVKPVSQTNFLVHRLRKMYYGLLQRISEVEIVQDCTGFGLYDHRVIKELRKIQDPYPFLRGLICELGFPIATIAFAQPRRLRGITKNNFYSLFDIAMLGIISHSKVPLRLATFFGLILGFFSFAVALYYTIMKLLYWDSFPMGLAPLTIGFFLFMSLVFIFIGLLGEYIASIHTYVQHRPIVIEKERINFESSD